MLKLNTNQPAEQPLLARFIFFKGDATPMKNRLIWITDRFLITAKNKNDVHPVWYNIDAIDRMVSVEILPTEETKAKGE